MLLLHGKDASVPGLMMRRDCVRGKSSAPPSGREVLMGTRSGGKNLLILDGFRLLATG